YAQKSISNITDISHTCLLQLMVDKLNYWMKCQEVYVSPYCMANDAILDRDSSPFQTILSPLKGCHGDITGLTSQLHYLQQPVQLVIIDYAGLSTSSEDISNYLIAYTRICKIVIDHGGSVELLSQYQLLEKNEVEKFYCHNAPVQRSK
ncbi:hypothetical protein BDF14DRAFT_1736880, partial [Spinellus fusiger]